MSLILVSSATIEPVTSSDMRDHLRIQTTAEDTLLGLYIIVARQQAENYMKRQIMRATWKIVIDDFPGATGHIELLRPPLSTASTDVVITYVKDDTAGTIITLGATVYTVDYESEPGRVFPSYDNEWPSCVRDQPNAVTITYKSGATTATDVPESIKQWIKLRVGAMYEYREPVSEINVEYIKREFIDGLLDPYMVIKIS